MELSAIVIAPKDRGPRITGLTLGERGRRVAIRAGVPEANVHVVRTAAELPQIDGRALLVIDASAQVVAVPLVEPLLLDQPGARKAVDARGYAGAARVDDAAAAIARLREDLHVELDGEPVEVTRRARHVAGTREEIRAATKWQWEIVYKPLDSVFTRYFWRPCARPLTWTFVQLPFSPNQISIVCILLAIAGGIVAGTADYTMHLVGIAILFLSALADNVDGEVARLRLQSSRAGGWLDTIGDDVSRVAILWGLGFYTAAKYPDLPVVWLLVFTLAHSMVSFALLYWWCIFVGKTYNNQDYAKSLGLGPGLEQKQPGGFGKMISEAGILMARRDFLDLGITILAIANLSEISFAGLCLGQLIGIIVLIPMHFKIVAKRRQAARALDPETLSASSR